MRALNLVAGLALAVALVGCSDDGGGEADGAATESTPSASSEATESAPEAEEPAPEDQLEAAYHAYIGAFLTGDGATAYALLSERCKEETPLSDFASGSESAAELYGPVEYEIKSVTVDGDEGRVSAKFPVAALQGGDPEGSLWLLEGGEWHSDKC